MQCFKNALAYFARIASYTRKMFVKLTAGTDPQTTVSDLPTHLQPKVLLGFPPGGYVI
jgi:hypothetical protein